MKAETDLSEDYPMQAYVMSGIAGLKVTLDYDRYAQKCIAKVPGYKDAVAHLPMETRDAVLTAGGMLAYRNNSNKVQAVMIENHQDVISAAEAEEKVRRQTATVCTGTIRADKISFGTIRNYDAAKHRGFGTIMTREQALSMLSDLKPGLEEGRKTALTRIDPGEIDITTPAHDSWAVAGKIESFDEEDMRNTINSLTIRIDRNEQQIRDLKARISELEAAIGQPAVTSREPAADLDRTCTESGGLFMGPMATVTDNPFVRKNKTGP